MPHDREVRAVFVRASQEENGNDGHDEIFAATPYAGGPWSPDAQHGGAVCGLLGRALERIPTPVPMRIARVTFELMRPVPLTPLRVRTDVVRTGKRTPLAQASLHDGDTEVARATALSLRTTEGLGLEAGPNVAPDEPLPFAPGRGLPPTIRVEHLPGYLRAIDFVRADGEPDGKRASTVWFRMRVPLVEGEAPTPFVRLASACDFTSGVANALDFGRHVSINPDVTLYVERVPRSDWIGVRGSTRVNADGTGFSQAEIYDAKGRIATAATALFVDVRGAPVRAPFSRGGART